MCEKNAITTAVTSGMKKIKYIYVTGNTAEPISPCGACRQVINWICNRWYKNIFR